MTQLQFDMICKVIQGGAPALAEELCGALRNLILDYRNMAEELSKFKEGDTETMDENPA